ncbi:MAG: MFS transporter [Anaerolineales bacterium]|nr:MFS transporter [Anaerolineales bacterium]
MARTVFVLALGMVAMTFVFARMPAAHAAPVQAAVERMQSTQRIAVWAKATGFFRLHENNVSTYATIVAGSLSYFAAMQLMVAHGAWLQSQYGLGPAQLGLVAFVFGWFDLAASVCVSLFTDRIGKKRSVLLGIMGSLVGYAMIPFLNLSVIVATVSIAVTRMFFEFNIVSHFPLLSEQAPDERGKVMTLGSAVALLGGSLAGFTGPWLLVNRGVSALAWTSAAAVLLALCVVLIAVKDPGARH